MKLPAAATALLAVTIAVTAATILASPAHAEIRPTPGTPAVSRDKPFHYAKGDHLDRKQEVPSRSRYGYGRPIYLVGDSMAGQLSDGLLRVAKAQHRALLPRSRGGVQFMLPEDDSSRGRWSGRIFRQIQAERGRRPIVVISGWYHSVTALRETIAQLQAEANASVLVVTSTPIPPHRYGACVARAVRQGKNPNRVCRWRVANRGPGSSESLRAAREAGVPALDLFPVVARGRGSTHPPVARSTFIHRNPAHVTATFSRRLLYKPLRNAVERAD